MNINCFENNLKLILLIIIFVLALRRSGRACRQEGSFPRRVHQAAVGLPQEEQPPGSREQAVLHPGQEDGQGEISFTSKFKLVRSIWHPLLSLFERLDSN